MNINEVLKTDYDLCCKELKKATKKIEKLEEDIKYYVSLKEEIRQDYENTFELMNIFKERIDKAVEYIDNDFNKFDCFGHLSVAMEMNYKREELLDILKGSDKDGNN